MVTLIAMKAMTKQSSQATGLPRSPSIAFGFAGSLAMMKHMPMFLCFDDMGILCISGV